MQDRQVEIVAGDHAVARVCGAVLVVAHRGRGPVGPESPAAVALNALGDLVRDAQRFQPSGPGPLVAREATRWLMKHAERISPGVPIDFGILSPAEQGGLAVFLHGGVTAVLADAGAVERLRGSDAAFTVDRVVTVPARAAGLFVDDVGGRVPELPATPGIGRLVDGVAQACGAILWTGGGWSAAGTGSRREIADAPPVPTARIEQEPRAQAPTERDIAPSATREASAVSAREASAVSAREASAVSAREASAVSAREAPAVSAVDSGDTATRTAAPTSMMDSVDEQTAARPRMGMGTNPAPRPDPELQRRLEATAKATALTVKVLGFKCARAHPSDPRSAFCTVCGMPVDQTQALIEVVRPPLGMLVLDDGMTYMLAADAVLGRDPEHSEAAQQGLVPLKIDDASGGMSRAHAEIRLVNWDVTVVDRGSTNGTRTRLPGYRDWVRLNPYQPMTLIPGSEVMLGNRVLRLEPVAPPPFGG
ncbi:FHA domain-containing protein [Nocardia shimofusensis]|uniref:FHA domain-containing protein n=1 Tax=Nocardia shimofusensis TaxID=228596 RepID=UPI00083189F8|nr:FHA domain-containing protein [Nocardia shimofusensis]